MYVCLCKLNTHQYLWFLKDIMKTIFKNIVNEPNIHSVMSLNVNCNFVKAFSMTPRRMMFVRKWPLCIFIYIFLSLMQMHGKATATRM